VSGGDGGGWRSGGDRYKKECQARARRPWCNYLRHRVRRIGLTARLLITFRPCLSGPSQSLSESFVPLDQSALTKWAVLGNNQ